MHLLSLFDSKFISDPASASSSGRGGDGESTGESCLSTDSGAGVGTLDSGAGAGALDRRLLTADERRAGTCFFGLFCRRPPIAKLGGGGAIGGPPMGRGGSPGGSGAEVTNPGDGGGGVGSLESRLSIESGVDLGTGA